MASRLFTGGDSDSETDERHPLTESQQGVFFAVDSLPVVGEGMDSTETAAGEISPDSECIISRRTPGTAAAACTEAAASGTQLSLSTAPGGDDGDGTVAAGQNSASDISPSSRSASSRLPPPLPPGYRNAGAAAPSTPTCPPIPPRPSRISSLSPTPQTIRPSPRASASATSPPPLPARPTPHVEPTADTAYSQIGALVGAAFSALFTPSSASSGSPSTRAEPSPVTRPLPRPLSPSQPHRSPHPFPSHRPSHVPRRSWPTIMAASPSPSCFPPDAGTAKRETDTSRLPHETASVSSLSMDDTPCNAHDSSRRANGVPSGLVRERIRSIQSFSVEYKSTTPSRMFCTQKTSSCSFYFFF